MRVGIDSYSYHRRYSEIRPGESAHPSAPWPLEPAPVLEHARSLDVDDLMLETCYLPPPEALAAASFGEDDRPLIGFSWGHPWPEGAYHGLHRGVAPGAEEDLARWIDAAARLGHGVMRITLGSPATRGLDPSDVLIARLVDPVRRAADLAAAVDLELAIENHGDLSADELIEIITRVDRPNLGVTLDNLNLIRLGDDMVEGTTKLAPLTRIVQLKDHLPTDDVNQPGGPTCTALGEGVAPLEAVLATLDEAGFDGPVCVEIASLGPEPVDELALIERSVRWLRERLS
jgi:sugar phosphate isomerase/epimerase